MRIAAEVLLPLLFLVGALWYFSGQYIAMRKANRKLVRAYFTGGPMNGMERKLEECPEQYTYLYAKTVLVQESKGDVTTTPQTARMVAVYHLDGTDYVYKGSVSDDDTISITEKDLLKLRKDLAN